jgi:hypothetical protein
MRSPIYQYVINLVMSLPIRRGPGVLMNVSVPSTHLHILNETKVSHYLILHAKKLRNLYSHNVGRDSIVSIATPYGLDGPGIESWWG